MGKLLLDNDLILNLHNRGLSLSAIARSFKVSNWTIKNRFDKLGIVIPPFKTLDENEIVELFKQGKTKKYLAGLFGISVGPIKRILRKHGVKRPIKYPLDECAFSVFTDASCYWAGFIAADGWVGKIGRSNRISVELSVKDAFHLKKLCRFIKRDENLTKRIKNLNGKNFSSCTLTICNKNITQEIMKNFNLVPAKSLILSPPNNMPLELARDYIRGYFDGDGCICTRKKGKIIIFNLISGSKDILVWMNGIIFNSAGIKMNVRKCKDRNMYVIQTERNNAKIILDWLYSDSISETRLDRKYEKYLESCKL